MQRRKSTAVAPSDGVLPRLVGAKAAAREIGIPYTTLREATFRGYIPVIKIGRAWYFDRKDLAEFIATNKETLR